MKIKLEPIDDRIIIKPDESQNMTAGGLHIPETARDRALAGTVTEVGKGRFVDNLIVKLLNDILTKLDPNYVPERVPVNVKVGDRVLYARYAGDEIEYLGEKHFFIRESDIVAFIYEEEEEEPINEYP